MSVRLVWTPRSKRDLADIFDWIAADRPRAAERIYTSLTARAQMLIQTPYLGRAESHLLPGIRVLTETPYLLYYRVLVDPAGEPEAVDILRIAHGNRFAPDLFRR